MSIHLKRLLCFACAFALSFGIAALSACSGNVDGSEDNESSDGAGGGSEQSGSTGDEGGGAVGEGVLGAEYIVFHADGAIVTYTFEAECTNLTNKMGVSQSGEMTESGMAQACSAASNGAAVDGMKLKGLSLNFIIISDRDVENAELSFSLGEAYGLRTSINAQSYLVRIDPVNEEDLHDYTEDGAWGKWDDFFLNYYTEGDEVNAANYDPEQCAAFKGYYIDRFEVSKNIVISATSTNVSETKFADYLICSNLKLNKGANCISLIVNNTENYTGSTIAATFYANAPIVDCIKIKTDAQLGMYAPQNNNNFGTANACTYK